MRIDADEWIGIAIFSFIALVIGLTIAYSIVESRWDRECMDNGYRDAKVVWFMTPYCVQRVDQTDIVVSLKRVREGERYGD